MSERLIEMYSKDSSCRVSGADRVQGSALSKHLAPSLSLRGREGGGVLRVHLTEEGKGPFHIAPVFMAVTPLELFMLADICCGDHPDLLLVNNERAVFFPFSAGFIYESS